MLERCLMHPDGGCRFARHGIYGRKTPSGLRGARYYFPDVRMTSSPFRSSWRRGYRACFRPSRTALRCLRRRAAFPSDWRLARMQVTGIARPSPNREVA